MGIHCFLAICKTASISVCLCRSDMGNICILCMKYQYVANLCSLGWLEVKWTGVHKLVGFL